MAEIFYETDLVQLWHGGAEEILPGMKTESYDLVLTDPPYGVEYKSGMRRDAWEVTGDGADPESRDVVEQILLQCVRLVGQNRHLYVFGPESLARIDAKVSKPAQLIWSKGAVSMGDLSSPWGPGHEELHFYTSLHRHAGKRGKETGPVRLRKGSVLTYGRKTGRTLRHPTEKPLDLLAELVESSSRVGETLLDPFAGVGSTGVAAVLAGRKAVLVELELEYCQVAKERLEKAEHLRQEMRNL